uniref:Magnesium transport protein CorA n=1 Tax=Desulfobacca acetoxidans TaxID=60893 RepID=A0A7V4G8B0_9BACT
MAKLLKKRSAKTGLPPGTLIYLGEKTDKETQISIFTYNAGELHTTTRQSFRECPAIGPGPTVTWINVNGLHKVANLEELGACFNFHPLVLEDILNTDQRPKLEDYGDYLFIVVKMLHLKGATREIVTEQVSLILGENYLISLHEQDDEVFLPIMERLQANRGRIRKEGADYLAYALLDLIVDHYFLVLEELGEVIEGLEAELVARPNPVTLNRIHHLKRDTIMLRKAVWPLREVISRLERSDSPLIKSPTVLYLKDVYDHVIQVIDNIETFRDILSGMLDIYLSSVSNRLNEIMKVLTIIATIFIPLTFITGIYGMNFERLLPEKEWPWGFYAIMGFMAAVAGGMLLFFRSKGWLGGKSEPPKP